jgi:hypothetical protein
VLSRKRQQFGNIGVGRGARMRDCEAADDIRERAEANALDRKLQMPAVRESYAGALRDNLEQGLPREGEALDGHDVPSVQAFRTQQGDYRVACGIMREDEPTVPHVLPVQPVVGGHRVMNRDGKM